INILPMHSRTFLALISIVPTLLTPICMPPHRKSRLLPSALSPTLNMWITLWISLKPQKLPPKKNLPVKRLEELFSSQTNPAPSPSGGTQLTVPPSSGERSRLNVHYHFDNFITGSSNRFAHAAAYAVSEQPAKSYNPLFIYGESGLGKTHLLHAIGHYAQELFPGLRVRYVNSEEFTNDFINSIRHDEGASFKQIYRN